MTVTVARAAIGIVIPAGSPDTDVEPDGEQES